MTTFFTRIRGFKTIGTNALVMLLGIGKQFSAGNTRYSAIAPGASPGQPMNRSLRQVFGRPVRHWSHWPQTMAGSTATRSAGLIPCTAGPTSTTVPEHSCPMVAGYSTI